VVAAAEPQKYHFALVENKTDTRKKISPPVRKELNMQMPTLMGADMTSATEEMLSQPVTTADSFLRQMNTDFEVFFFKRDYNAENFAFYL
jgi:hypothetical protein